MGTRNAFGQWLTHHNMVGGPQTAASFNRMRYDGSGRLMSAADVRWTTDLEPVCITRTYEFDRDSNRRAINTQTDGSDICDAGPTTRRTIAVDDADRVVDSGFVYDQFGRTTTVPAAALGRPNGLTATYAADDQMATAASGSESLAYARDPARRVRQTTNQAGQTTTLRYDADDDAPARADRSDGTFERYIANPAGDLLVSDQGGGQVTYLLRNLHGDVIATADDSVNGPFPSSPVSYDEFGRKLAGTPGTNGWLGAKQRASALDGLVIQMGVRTYVPALGRFLQVDPVDGGSANAYDYANQDPVNETDLSGRCPWCVPLAIVAVRVGAAAVKSYRASRVVAATTHDVARTRVASATVRSLPYRVTQTYAAKHPKQVKVAKVVVKAAKNTWSAYRKYKGYG